MVEAALVSHAGRVRTENEDYAYHGETPHGYVGIVCDGMGGEAAGEVAARVAADAAFQYLLTAPPDSNQLLKEAIQAAQTHLIQVANRHPQYQSFGTTITITLIKGNILHYAHVGDSRIYLFSRNTLTLLTEDDSLVQQMLKEGLITPEQAIHHPKKNILSQCLGPRQQPTPHIGQTKLRSGDVVLLCTDGLSNLLSQDEIIAQLTQAPNLSVAADNLVSHANRQGGYDNITVLLLRPLTKTPTFAVSMKLPPTKYLIAGGIGLMVIILLVVVFSRGSTPNSNESDEVILLSDSAGTASDEALVPPPSSDGNLPPSPESEPGQTPPSPSTSEVTSPAPPVTETPQPPTETHTTSSKTATSTKTSSSKSPSSGKTSTIEITVQKGDNLTQIAKAFHTTRSAIQKANNLQSENIRSGQKLSIPVQAVKSHTVQKGENLSRLAREYRSSVEAIRRANALSDKDEIRAGQKLRIPILE